jgi:hypothetical protein
MSNFSNSHHPPKAKSFAGAAATGSLALSPEERKASYALARTLREKARKSNLVNFTLSDPKQKLSDADFKNAFHDLICPDIDLIRFTKTGPSMRVHLHLPELVTKIKAMATPLVTLGTQEFVVDFFESDVQILVARKINNGSTIAEISAAIRAAFPSDVIIGRLTECRTRTYIRSTKEFKYSPNGEYEFPVENNKGLYPLSIDLNPQTTFFLVPKGACYTCHAMSHVAKDCPRKAQKGNRLHSRQEQNQENIPNKDRKANSASDSAQEEEAVTKAAKATAAIPANNQPPATEINGGAMPSSDEKDNDMSQGQNVASTETVPDSNASDTPAINPPNPTSTVPMHNIAVPVQDPMTGPKLNETPVQFLGESSSSAESSANKPKKKKKKPSKSIASPPSTEMYPGFVHQEVNDITMGELTAEQWDHQQALLAQYADHAGRFSYPTDSLPTRGYMSE